MKQAAVLIPLLFNNSNIPNATKLSNINAKQIIHDDENEQNKYTKNKINL